MFILLLYHSIKRNTIKKQFNDFFILSKVFSSSLLLAEFFSKGCLSTHLIYPYFSKQDLVLEIDFFYLSGASTDIKSLNERQFRSCILRRNYRNLQLLWYLCQVLRHTTRNEVLINSFEYDNWKHIIALKFVVYIVVVVENILFKYFKLYTGGLSYCFEISRRQTNDNKAFALRDLNWQFK